jgi:SAM-dependent methyltransferase
VAQAPPDQAHEPVAPPVASIPCQIVGTPAPTVTRYTRFKYFGLPYLRRQGIRPAKILDYGCAYGAFGFDLARRYPDAGVFLYDANSAVVEKCRTIARRGGFTNVGILDDTGLEKENGFSLVLLISVLEHVQEDRRLLETLRGKLATDGLLFVMTPAGHGHECSEKDHYLHHVRPGYGRSQLVDLDRCLGVAGAEPVVQADAELIPGRRQRHPRDLDRPGPVVSDAVAADHDVAAPAANAAEAHGVIRGATSVDDHLH